MIRVGRLSDIPFVKMLEDTVFSDPWSEADLCSHITAPHLRLWICEMDGCPVGYLLGSIIPPEGEIYRVAVLPTLRRAGAGEALCRALLAECRCAYLEVRRGNTAARALYEKLGFTPVGERKNYYKNPTEDAALYRWQESLCE